MHHNYKFLAYEIIYQKEDERDWKEIYVDEDGDCSTCVTTYLFWIPFLSISKSTAYHFKFKVKKGKTIT